MKVKDLKAYLDDFPDDAPVVIWSWNNGDESTHRVELCVNYEYQQEQKKVMLRMGFEEEAVEEALNL